MLHTDVYPLFFVGGGWEWWADAVSHYTSTFKKGFELVLLLSLVLVILNFEGGHIRNGVNNVDFVYNTFQVGDFITIP